MKVIKKIIKYLSYSILSILVLFSLYTLVMTKILHKSYVNVFGYTYFVVASGSMSGTIEVNDIVIVKVHDSYGPQDIITYNDDGAFITHRVIKIEGEKIITRGDVNNTNDEPIDKDSVIGRVVFVVAIASVLKVLAVLLFIFIIYVIVNFDKIFKKYISHTRERNKKEEDKPPLEYTQTINVNSDNTIPLVVQRNNNEAIALDEQQKFLNLVLKIFKLRKRTLKLTKDGSLKLKFVYELAVLDLCSPEDVPNRLKNIPFEELYDYDFEDIYFTQSIQNKLYEMPMYIFLKIMTYALLYDENEYFDAVYKVLKYRIKIDRDISFIRNNKHIDEVLTLIEKIVINVGCEEDFDLRKVRDKIIIDREIKNIEILETVKICPNCNERITDLSLKKCPYCSSDLK